MDVKYSYGSGPFASSDPVRPITNQCDTAETFADPRVGITTSHHTAVAPSTANAAADTYDARLIRQARELANLNGFDAKRNWLVANGRPEVADYAAADRYDDINAMIMGTMKHVLSSLATGYERELAAVKALTGRA